MRGLAGFIVNRPWPVLLLVIFLSAGAFVGVVRLTFNDGLSHVFSSQNPVFAAYIADQEQFPATGSPIAVHLMAQDFTDPTIFATARDFALDAGLVPGVTGSFSVFSLRTAPNVEGQTAPLFGADAAASAQLRAQLQAAVQHPLNRGRLLSADLEHLLVVVQPQSQQSADLGLVLEEITSLSAKMLTPQDISFSITGMPSLRVSTIRLLIRDQMVINVVAAGIGFFLCLIAFKGLVPALIAGLPAVFALIFVLGFMGFWGTGINTATNALPVLILVLAFADSMHLTFETRRRLAMGGDGRDAIVSAFSLAAMPCILASVTTAIAFASLMFSGSELITGLGAAGSIGVMISLCVVLIVNPLLSALAVRLDLKGWTRGRRVQPLLFPDKSWQRLLTWCLQRARWVAAIGVLGLAVALGVYSQTGVRYSFFEYVPQASADYQALREVEQVFAPLHTYDVMVPIAPQREGEIDQPTLEAVGKVHGALSDVFGPDRVVSIWTVAQWVAPQDPASAAPTLSQLFDQAAAFGGNGFISQSGDVARVSVLTTDPGSQEVARAADKITEIAKQALPETQTRVGGLLHMGAVVASEMIFDLNRSFLAAVVFSGVLVAVWMRSLRVGVVAVIVNVLPISMVGAYLVLSGNQLQFTSGLALTIAFGIAVDDTLHALNRLRPKYLAGEAVTREDIDQAFFTVAPVLTATSVILSFGLGATFLSGMPSIAYFGQLSIAVFILALVADLILLPALLLLMQKKGASVRFPEGANEHRVE